VCLYSGAHNGKERSHRWSSFPLPRLARQLRNQPRGYGLCRAFHVPLVTRRKQRADIGGELPVAKFGGEVLLEQRARHMMAAVVHVSGKRGNDAGGIGLPFVQRDGKVEEVPALFALVERPQLGAKKLIQ